MNFKEKVETTGWVPNPPFANPREAEKAPWRSLQSGVAGVYSLFENPYRFLSFPLTFDTLVRPQ